MEVSTIIGIVVAVVICVVGLKMLLRKPNDAAPSLDSELQINEDSQQPVIPRHVRDQLQADASATAASARVEPSLNAQQHVEPVAVDSVQQADLAPSNEATADKVTDVSAEPSAETQPQTKLQTKATEAGAEQSSDHAELDSQADVKTDTTATDANFALNTAVKPAEIQAFDEESSILDLHLHEQQVSDDESTLANAESIIALNVYPNPRKALSGDKTLKLLLKYGLRFGEMNCFHRYEHPEEASPLMFSVLRITDEGPADFDLEALLVEQVKGLAFFLALPHQNVQKGYDSMVSIAGLIAREIDGTVYDENNLEFTPQLKEHWRHKAIDYRAGQEA